MQATNAKNKTIEVSIFTKRKAGEIIKLMFDRWIQENDFKYPDKHYGIDQITSYAATNYRKLEKIIEDKQIKSGAFKGVEKEKTKIKRSYQRNFSKNTLAREKIKSANSSFQDT